MPIIGVFNLNFMYPGCSVNKKVSILVWCLLLPGKWASRYKRRLTTRGLRIQIQRNFEFSNNAPAFANKGNLEAFMNIIPSPPFTPWNKQLILSTIIVWLSCTPFWKWEGRSDYGKRFFPFKSLKGSIIKQWLIKCSLIDC